MTEPVPDPQEEVRRFREAERAKMLATIQELIDDAQRRSQSSHTLSRERTKWTSVAGKLIWYKDQILRSLDFEALSKDVAELKRKYKENQKQHPAPFTRRLP